MNEYLCCKYCKKVDSKKPSNKPTYEYKLIYLTRLFVAIIKFLKDFTFKFKKIKY